MSEIRGEYWIIDGTVEFADGDSGDKNHEMIAYEHIAHSHLHSIYNFTVSLGINVPSLSSIEYSEEASGSVHDLLTVIKKTLFSQKDPNNPNLPLFKNDAEIIKHIKHGTGIDEEALRLLMQGVFFGASLDPRVYVMKKYGWIVLRNNNVELYGYNDQKRRETIHGVEDALEQEGIEESDEEIELSIYDHKTKRSWDSTLSDLKSGGARAVTSPSTTYNKPLMVPTKGLNLAQRQAMFTSESFKEWLLHNEMLGSLAMASLASPETISNIANQAIDAGASLVNYFSKPKTTQKVPGKNNKNTSTSSDPKEIKFKK